MFKFPVHRVRVTCKPRSVFRQLCSSVTYPVIAALLLFPTTRVAWSSEYGTAWRDGHGVYIASSGVVNIQKNWLGYWESFDIHITPEFGGQICVINCTSTGGINPFATGFVCNSKWTGECTIAYLWKLSSKSFNLTIRTLVFNDARMDINSAIQRNFGLY